MNDLQTPQLTIPRVMHSALSQSEYMRKVVKYYNGEDDWRYKAIDAYKQVKNVQAWELCPNCGLFPKVWEFDNGRATACGCGVNQYDHFKVFAESIMSVCKNSYNGQSAENYDLDALRKNWNHWAKNGEFLFVRDGSGRW